MNLELIGIFIGLFILAALLYSWAREAGFNAAIDRFKQTKFAEEDIITRTRLNKKRRENDEFELRFSEQEMLGVSFTVEVNKELFDEWEQGDKAWVTVTKEE